MPKKKQALPTPKAKLYTEDAALLVPIFQKEPFITFQELQDKYGDILTDQQIYRGLLGTFAPYVSERREEAFQEQLLHALEEYCYKEIKSVDILISIIGGRFGSESKRENSSISQTELKTAIKENKQIYVFVEKNVLSEYETYLLNKENSINYKFVDNVKIYQFIEEIKNLKVNNNIKGFETASDITRYLKEQFAGLFQRFLEEQTKIKEVSLIMNLERTSQNLNKLVTFLSEQNKGQTEDINRILMINHPLIGALREKLNIPYNFYIEGVNDLMKLIEARGYSNSPDEAPWDDDYTWIKFSKNGTLKETLTISKKIFDEENRLKYVNKSNWDDNYINQSFLNIPSSKEDDLPF